MPRVKRGVTARARHKSVIQSAKGYRGRRNSVFRIANQAVMRAGQNAYRDRRNKKRVFRSLWVARINAACRLHGINYSKFIHAMEHLSIHLDRKILSNMAIKDSQSFSYLVEKAKSISML